MAAIEVSPGIAGIEKGLAEVERRLSVEYSQPHVLAVPSSPTEMLASEEEHLEAGRRLADLRIAAAILKAHLDPQLRREACQAARERMRADGGVRYIKDGGWRATRVLLPGGLVLRLHTRYLRPSLKGRRGRPRGNGRRGAQGAGCFPILERLGIRDGVTPATRSEIARQSVLCSSFKEAAEQLARGGLVLHPSTIVRVATATGQQALDQRSDALEQARQEPLPDVSAVVGKRLRVSLDGGRARTRRTHRGRGIRPGKNGRRPFSLEWKEPRVITIDVLDDDGNIDRSWRPIYEVTLGDADETCALLVGLLRRIGAHLASVVLFVADGAKWMWKRISEVLKDAGVPVERTRLVLDYYHATEYISAALELCKNIRKAERKRLFGELCGLLLEEDGHAKVTKRLRRLARGRRGRKVNQKIRYLDEHREHMNYAELRTAALPIGSGIVESAVRRVINLRFKSASTCWRKDHLLPLLYLRAILKAGRWDAFMHASLQGNHWLERGGSGPLVGSASPELAA